MKYLPQLLLIIMSYTSVMMGQNQNCSHSISGKILDEVTKTPVPFATIRVENSNKYVQSDEEGNFLIEGLCSKSNTLIISCLGYDNATSDHHHDHGEGTHFYLKQNITDLDEVTVATEKKEEKGTQTISQITLNKADIISNPTQSLAASLSLVEGVTFTSMGSNVQLPVIHGLYGNRILILNNDLKHGFQNWGTDHAPEIDITAADRITVIKGAAGVRYGPEALGGAIVVAPAPLVLNRPFYMDLGTGYQTNGRGYNANLEIGNGTDNWSYFLNGSYTKIGDRKAPDYNLTNSGKEEKTFGLGILRHFNKVDFKVHYSFIDQNLAQLRSSIASSPDSFIRAINSDEPYIINPFSYAINEPNQIAQHHLGKAEIIWWYADNAKLSFIGGVQLNKREEFDVRRNAELPIIDLDLLTYDYQMIWKRGLNGLVGLQYFSQNNDNNPGTQTTAFIPNYNTERFSAFATESFNFGKNTIEAGVRFDFETNDVRGRETSQVIFRDDYNFTNFTATVGYIREFSDNATFRTNLGTAWRTPNMAELFSFGQHGYQTIFGLLRFTDTNGILSTSEVTPLDESDVEPERGYKFINELVFNTDKSSHNLTFYSHYIENFIFDRPIGVFGTIRGPMPAFIYDQADALFFGIDYTWRQDWSKKVSGNFGFSYLWSRNIAENEPLINQPPISTSYELAWEQGNVWFFDTSTIKVKPSYTFRQFQAPRTIAPESLVDGSVTLTTDSEIFDFIDAPEGYFLLDVSWNFNWKNFSGSIAAQNLLNTSYRDYLNEMRYFADEPGRNIIFTLNYAFDAKR